MPYMRELPHGKWAVYDDKGKLVIMTRNKIICQKQVEKLNLERKTK